MSQDTPSSPFTVALTGGIAAGKTTVSDRFAARGIPVLDADVAARKVVEPGMPAFKEIVITFGKKVIGNNGQLDRHYLRRKIFANTQARKQLEAITHPRIQQWLKEQLHQQTASWCLLVIPLLAETWQQWSWVDRVLLIKANTAIRIERLIRRDSISQQQAHTIIQAQATENRRQTIANDIIYNNDHRDLLDEQIENLSNHYRALARTLQ